MSVAIMDAGGDYGAVIVSGTNMEIDPARLEQEGLWEGATHLVLQNEIPEALHIAAAQAAHARGLSVVLNAAPARTLSDTLVQIIDILVVNAGEAEALCGIAVASLIPRRTLQRLCPNAFGLWSSLRAETALPWQGMDGSIRNPGIA